MAEYNREENYEIKYLRKVLGQVDNRIQVPARLDAESLRGLLDNIEPTTTREVATRRPRWLSLQSGIAYAAAFALIVALFYSMRLYRPDIIDGGMKISHQEKSTSSLMVVDAPSQAVDETAPVTDSVMVEAAIASTVEVKTSGGDVSAPEPQAQPNAVTNSEVGIGGGGKSSLILEQDGFAYYWRMNDATSPDNPNQITFEAVNEKTQELVSQINLPDIERIDACFAINNRVLIVGALNGNVKLSVYDIDDRNTNQLDLILRGEFLSAAMSNDVVHIVSISSTTTPNAEDYELPNADASSYIIVTNVNLASLETQQKSYVASANATVEMQENGAIVHYSDGTIAENPKNYEARLSFDGLNINLET